MPRKREKSAADAPPKKAPQRSKTSSLSAHSEARITRVLELLSELYPSPKTELDHENPFQLLIATILSAQSTDKGVNLATPALFEAYPDAAAMAKAEPEQLYPFINRLGLFRNKAKSLVETARALTAQYSGEVPADREALMALPGVGRKTANVVLANAFGIPAIAVDTHVFRVSQRLGLAKSEKVDEIEQQLMRVIPERSWNDAHHWLILHGRRVCDARRPRCGDCPLFPHCPGRLEGEA